MTFIDLKVLRAICPAQPVAHKAARWIILSITPLSIRECRYLSHSFLGSPSLQPTPLFLLILRITFLSLCFPPHHPTPTPFSSPHHHFPSSPFPQHPFPAPSFQFLSMPSPCRQYTFLYPHPHRDQHRHHYLATDAKHENKTSSRECRECPHTKKNNGKNKIKRVGEEKG